jgi:hypothetical protein
MHEGELKMIRHIDLLTTPMKPGEIRDLTIWGDEPHAIAIKCFLWTPPPPGFKECPTCGEFNTTNGVSIKIAASENLFVNVGGQLRISITDSAGDRRELDIDVTP